MLHATYAKNELLPFEFFQVDGSCLIVYVCYYPAFTRKYTVSSRIVWLLTILDVAFSIVLHFRLVVEKLEIFGYHSKISRKPLYPPFRDRIGLKYFTDPLKISML